MKILKWLDKNFETYFLITTLVVMVFIVTLQVVLRSFFKYSLTWAEEFTRYVMLYQIWLGASIAVKEDAHLRITSFRDSLSQKGQAIVELIVIVLWTVFAVFLAIKSGQLVNILFTRGQLSAAMRLPMGYAYASVTVGCALMAIRLIQKLYKLVRKFENKELEIKN